MSDPPTIGLTTDERAQATESFQRFRTLYRQFLDDIAQRLDKAIELNKQTAAFYEKLILVNLATISLSLTAVISLPLKLIELTVHSKQVIVWLVAPAWILLLFSAFVCRHILVILFTANKSLLDEWTGLVINYDTELLSHALQQLSESLSGKVVCDDEGKQLSAEVFVVHSKTMKAANLNAQQRLGAAAPTEIKRPAQYAAHSMNVAMILLSIAAIKLLFAL